ncbi:protein kinase [Lujinxingia vulgaris]|uniref:Protein kinase n=1 Tax=Lujinxingia vulgaris TaxID=2600176 RepID=A0A5C6XI36_9DELT|nr:serine/threonine-protein kinase [Lujinxingia vulgaris]TXD39188.1 protein kinase [Lujinxingia vulgaris]
MSDDKNIPELLDVEVEPLAPDDPASISQSHRPGTSPSGVSAVGSSPSRPARQRAVDPLIGTRLKDTYELVSKIGEGGMGNVYSAIQYPLERKVAVKVLKPTENNPDGEFYFMREVRAINMLRHPNIITIVDYGKEDDGTLYLVMEHLPGLTLKDVIKKEFPLDPKRICGILIQLLSALEQAHNAEIVHCDLKPANIMVEKVAGQPDFVKVLDFGIAKVKGPAMEAGPYTQAGNIVGTFDYMSPEQIMRKDDLDGRADVWSVGVILYEMLTRKRIFHAKDAVTIIGRVMQSPIRPPSEIAPDVPIPPVLEHITMRAMERNVRKRYQTAKEMRDALQRALNELESGHTGNVGLYSGDTGSASGNYSGSLAASGLVRGGTGNMRGGTGNMRPATGPGPDSGSTSRTGLSSLYTRSGGFGAMGLEQSQRLATGIAAGTSVLDQTFSADALEGSLAGERRKVAVLAIQQRSRRKSGIDPEELARRSRQEKKLIEEVVRHFDGEIDSNLGGTYTVLFGARKARVGDNVRAVECAVALQQKFRSLEQGADHIGIGLVYGEVFVSDRKGGNAYGEAIDRAIEIARGVREAKIFADEDLIDATREQVRFSNLRAVAGEEAAEVLGIEAPAAQAPRDLAEIDVYVPRPVYFDELMRRATTARGTEPGKGAGGGVAILGDLGTGKTLLLNRYASALSESGWQTFVVKDAELGAAQVALQPVRSWIRQIAQTYKDPAVLITKACEAIGLNKKHITPVLQVFLGQQKDALNTPDVPWSDAQGFSNFAAALLYRLLRFAMKKGPVLLAIDDVMVEDRFTIDFIDNLLAGIQKQPILIAVTRRIESTALDHGLPGNFEILQIGGFSEDESRQFVAQVLGYTPPPEIVAQVHARSSGNPMFLYELVRAVLQKSGGKLASEKELLDAGVPLNLQELLAARVDALPDQLRDVLAIASVVGESFREDFFMQIVPAHLDPQGALQDLVALNFLEARFDGFERIHVAFQPRALRRVAYERLPKSTRAQLHSRIIEFLEGAPDFAAVDPIEYPLMVAFHYRAVEGFEGAAYYLTRAGELLLELYDYAGAIDNFQEAVELLEGKVEATHETRLTALARQLVAMRESGRLEDAQRVIDALPDLDALDGALRHDLLYERGLIAMDAGGIEESKSSLETLLNEAVEAGDLKREIKALLALAQLFEKENQLPHAANLLMQVSQKVEQVGDLDLQDPDDRKLFWTAYNQLGTLFIRQKDYQRAQQFLQTAYQQARAIEDFRGLVRVMSNFGALSLSVRDVKRAQQYFENAAQFARATGDLLNQSRIFTNLGITAMEAGELEQAKEYFRSARSLAEEIGWYEGLAELSLHIKRLRKALS